MNTSISFQLQPSELNETYKRLVEEKNAGLYTGSRSQKRSVSIKQLHFCLQQAELVNLFN